MNEELLEGLQILTPAVFKDERGYFFESYNKKRMEVCDINDVFVQDNESCSSKGVIRGLHYQLEPAAQSKLVRVIRGAIIDFVLDIRKSSPTFGQMYFIYLSSDNFKQFYIPHGFAHGFLALEDCTVFSYKCDNFYDKGLERGISIFDESLDIFGKLNKLFINLNRKVDMSNLIISEKDKHHPNFKDADYFE